MLPVLQSFRPPVRSCLSSLKRYLLPNSCVVCQRLVEQSTPDELVCAVCRSRLRPVGAGCDRCSQPLPPVGPCRDCEEWPAGIDFVRSAVWLDREARMLVHGLKYRGLQLLGERIAAEIALRIPRPGDLLVPIPLGPRRLRRRGYNQASCIANALGLLWDIPVLDGAVTRCRETESQTELTPDERTENVSGAFAAGFGPEEAGVRWGESNLHLVLVDDVYTTGATIVAAADGLLAAGWERVGGVTFARARTFDSRVLLGHNEQAIKIQR